jgi:hypothetical protein
MALRNPKFDFRFSVKSSREIVIPTWLSEGNLSQQHRRNRSVVDVLKTTGLRNLDFGDQYAHTAQKDF